MAKERITHYRWLGDGTVDMGGGFKAPRQAVCGWVRWGIKKRKTDDGYVYIQHSYAFELSLVTCPDCAKKGSLLVLDDMDL